MAIINYTDIAPGVTAVTVDHDPKTVATDVPEGTIIYSETTKQWYRKQDDGITTNVGYIENLASAGEEPVVISTYDEDETYQTVSTTVWTNKLIVPVTVERTGLYYVFYRAIVQSQSNSDGEIRLYDQTNLQVIDGPVRFSPQGDSKVSVSALRRWQFPVGVTENIAIQWRSLQNGKAQSIEQARLAVFQR